MERPDASSGQVRPPLHYRLTGSQRLGIDVVVAVTAFVCGILNVHLPRVSSTPAAPRGLVGLVFVGLGCLPISVRRRWPIGVLGAVVAAAAVLTALGRSPFAVDVTVGIAFYTVASHFQRRTAAILFVAAEAVLGAGATVAVARDVPGAYVIHILVTAGAMCFVGDSVRVHRQYRENLDAQEARRRGEQDEHERQAAREERVRIARELHDVLAHSLTVMTVQAEVARRVTRRLEDAQRTLESIETTGRTAQGELRVILGLLRDDDHEDSELAPAPTLDDIEALTEKVRAAGLPVELHVAGIRRPLPPALELSLYRIIQEALTNVVKHAGSAKTTVDMVYGTSEIRVEVVDDCRSGRRGRLAVAEPAAPAPSRHGIVGMHERAAAFGGTLVAELVPDSGFRVSASFPLGDQA